MDLNVLEDLDALVLMLDSGNPDDFALAIGIIDNQHGSTEEIVDIHKLLVAMIRVSDSLSIKVYDSSQGMDVNTGHALGSLNAQIVRLASETWIDPICLMEQHVWDNPGSINELEDAL